MIIDWLVPRMARMAKIEAEIKPWRRSSWCHSPLLFECANFDWRHDAHILLCSLIFGFMDLQISRLEVVWLRLWREEVDATWRKYKRPFHHRISANRNRTNHDLDTTNNAWHKNKILNIAKFSRIEFSVFQALLHTQTFERFTF